MADSPHPSVAISPSLSVTMPRDTWLLLLGWMAAKRPETDWDPGFLTAVIETVGERVNHA